MRSDPLFALLWRNMTWCSWKEVTLKPRHIPGWLNVVADELSRLAQIIQTEWSLLPEIFQVAPTLNRPICNEVQQQGSRCTQYILEGSGSLCLSTSGHSGQIGRKVKELPVQENHSHCTRVAQHALVLGSGSHLKSDPSVTVQPVQSADSAIQSDSTQESIKPKSIKA